MTRCTKAEAKGRGCVGEAGHRGRHKVREDPQTAYEAGGASPSGGAAARGASAGGGGLAGAAAALDAELAGLASDLRALLSAVQDRGGVIRRRFLALRKGLIKSRAQVARMRREWEGETARAGPVEADPDDLGDDDDAT